MLFSAWLVSRRPRRPMRVVVTAVLALAIVVTRGRQSPALPLTLRVTSSDAHRFGLFDNFSAPAVWTKQKEVVVGFSGIELMGVGLETVNFSDDTFTLRDAYPIYGSMVPGTNNPFAYVETPGLTREGMVVYADDDNFPFFSGGLYELVADGPLTVNPIAELGITPVPSGQGAYSAVFRPTPTLEDIFGPRSRGSLPVAFVGFDAVGDQGIYLFESDTISVVANQMTNVPSGTGTFAAFDSLALSGSNVVFNTPTMGPAGVFANFGSGLFAVADTTTPIPGRMGNFHSFAYPSVSGTNIAFVGTDPSFIGGVYGFFGSNLVVLADGSTPDPAGTGNLSNFLFSVISGLNYAFVARDGNDDWALFQGRAGGTESGTGLTRILGEGDALDGKTVSFVTLGPQGLDGGTLAFHVDFTDGSEGIYLSLADTLLGDYDGSGLVGAGDLDLVLNNWGVDSSVAGVPAGWVNDLPTGLISSDELDRVLGNWGNAIAASVPEPRCAALAALGLMLVRRRNLSAAG